MNVFPFPFKEDVEFSYVGLLPKFYKSRIVKSVYYLLRTLSSVFLYSIFIISKIYSVSS